jgi:hypothetical protein
MAYNGTGTFKRDYNWTTDAANGVNIEAVRMDGEDDGFATGLSNAITKDGQTTITANIPFNSKKITGLANGSARTDSIALGQVQDGTYKTLGTLGGSADTYTASPSPAITAYATGSEFNLKVNADNTGASTLNISAVAAKDVKKYDGAGAVVDLEAGDLQQDQYYKVIYDGTQFVVLNPQAPYISTINMGITATTSATGTVLLPNLITISNGTDADHDIDFTAGNFNFDDGSGQAIATALTKQIDAAWVAGDNAGGLDTGSVAPDTTYYCFVIWNPTTSTADFLFSSSHVSPTLPSGYTKKKRIAAFRVDGSANIRQGKYLFNPDGSYNFEYATKILDVSIAGSASTSKVNFGVTVPRDVIVKIRASMYRGVTTDAYVNLLSPYDNSLTPSHANADLISDNGFLGSIEKNILANDSAQLSYISSDSYLDNFSVITLGWFDSIKKY